jgi:hypothetical protein
MDAHGAKVATQPGFEETARFAVKWATPGTDYTFHQGCCTISRRSRSSGMGFLALDLLVTAFIAFCIGPGRVCGVMVIDLHRRRDRHAHYPIRDAIRFMLKRIIGLSDHELSLNDTWLRR